MNKSIYFLIALTLSACGSEDYSSNSKEAGGYVTESGNLVHCENTALFLTRPEDAQHLHGCQWVDGGIYIQADADITTLEAFGLNNIVHIEGQLHIADSMGLVNLNGLESLQSTSGAVFLLYNESLENTQGLKNVLSAPIIQIVSNPSLRSVDLLSLNKVEDLQITNNPGLKKVDLSSILYVEDRLSLVMNTQMNSLIIPEIIQVGTANLYSNGGIPDAATFEELLFARTE